MFDVIAIDKRLAECALPGVEVPTVRHDVTIFVPAQAGREYIIGVDSAGGGSEGDYACAQIIDRKTGMQCAELHGHLNPEELARKVARLGEEYGPAMLAVESNNQGAEVLAHLRRYSTAQIFSHKGKDGLLTTVNSRKEIVAAVSVALAEDPNCFNGMSLLREMTTFVLGKNGNGRAAAGAFDDRVMAMGVALRVRELELGKKWERSEELFSLSR